MFLSELITVEKASKIIESSVKSIGINEIPLKASYRRVLARDVISILDSPPFDRSAMDGYAIRAEDTFGFSENNPAHLKIVDRIGAGEISEVFLLRGEAIKIATGAPLPKGADAVVMEEYTQENDDKLEVEISSTPGEHVSFQGEDIHKNEVILRKGKILQPQDLAIIASAGYDQVSVFKKPRIGVINSGDELVMPSADVTGAEVVNSNYFMLKALLERSMAVSTSVQCPDQALRIEKQFEKLIKNHDAIITTGGTAISKGDVVVDVADNLGELYFHGVSIRPGKPFAFANIAGKPVFMLSGYPVAAMVQFDVFVRPALEMMQNINRGPLLVQRISTRKIPSTLGRTDYVRGKTKGDSVMPIKIKGSGIIQSMVQSNCYIVIEENLEGIAKGETCDVLLYPSLQI